MGRAISTAYEFLSKQFNGPARKPYYYADPDYIYSLADLHLVLFSAVEDGNVEILKMVFSKFKSSKDGQFGDYINRPYAGPRGPRIKPYTGKILFHAVRYENIEIIKLILKNGADPDIELSLREYQPNDEIRKLLIEYGRIDEFGLCERLPFALLVGLITLATYFSYGISPLVRYACTLIRVLLAAKSIHGVLCAQTKWPSPDFDEVNAEQVISSQEQGAASSSQNVLA